MTNLATLKSLSMWPGAGQPIPGWLLTPGGIVPALDMDFANNRAWAGAPAPISSLLSITNSGGYYTTAGGILVPFQANTLRYGDNGLLVEESRTNITQSSTNLSGTFGSWGLASGCTSTLQTAITAPDGTTTNVWAIRPTSNGNANGISNGSGTSTLPSTLSFYVKGAGITVIAGQDGQGAGWVFDTGTGLFSSVSANYGTPTSQQLANGWWRCMIPYVTNATPVVFLIGANAGANASNVFYLWGPQFEVGSSFATSYFPTPPSANATRNGDVVAFGSQSFVAANYRGTYYGQASINPAPSGSANRIWGGDGSYEPLLLVSATNTAVTSFGSATNLTATAGAGGWATTAKAAAGYDGSGRSVCMNNGAVVSDAVAWAGTNVSLGSQVSSNFLNGYLKRVAYWNSRLSNALLQAVTT